MLSGHVGHHLTEQLLMEGQLTLVIVSVSAGIAAPVPWLTRSSQLLAELVRDAWDSQLSTCPSWPVHYWVTSGCPCGRAEGPLEQGYPHCFSPRCTNTGVGQAMPKGGQCCVGSSPRHPQSPSPVVFASHFRGWELQRDFRKRGARAVGVGASCTPLVASVLLPAVLCCAEMQQRGLGTMLFLACPSGERLEFWLGSGQASEGSPGLSCAAGSSNYFFSPHKRGRRVCCFVLLPHCALTAGLHREELGDPHLISALGSWTEMAHGISLIPEGRGWAPHSQKDNLPPCWEELLGDSRAWVHLACYSSSYWMLRISDARDSHSSGYMKKLQVISAPAPNHGSGYCTAGT